MRNKCNKFKLPLSPNLGFRIYTRTNRISCLSAHSPPSPTTPVICENKRLKTGKSPPMSSAQSTPAWEEKVRNRTWRTSLLEHCLPHTLLTVTLSIKQGPVRCTHPEWELILRTETVSFISQQVGRNRSEVLFSWWVGGDVSSVDNENKELETQSRY